jgi:aldehyde dehydrogenase (NAD+)
MCENPLMDAYTDLKTTFYSGRTKDLRWRAEQLTAIERMMRERESDFIEALRQDLGKHAQESWMTEISYVSGDASYCRKNLRKWAKRKRIPTAAMALPARSWVQPEPLGVVLVIGAWNYPLQLTMAGAAAAIAAGNCVVVKPSELAPATSATLAKYVLEYLDGGSIRVVEGGVEATTELLEQPFDHILYTGGGNVARIVMSAAAKNLTPVTLELGGKSPCVVMPDADLEVAARRIAWGKFTNAGQTCIAPDYILTDVDTEARLLPLLEKVIREMFGDDPEQSDSYGRIVNDRHYERISRFIGDGHITFGGKTNKETRYIAPTILTDVELNSAVMQEEIFGPVLPIVRADDLDMAIQFIRERDKPLAAYIFTKDNKAEELFLDEVSCGSACVNDTMMFMAVHELPFGGVGASGMGAYSGKHGFDTFSHMKAVIKRGWWPDLAVRYAPYTDKKFAFLRKIR